MIFNGGGLPAPFDEQAKADAFRHGQ